MTYLGKAPKPSSFPRQYFSCFSAWLQGGERKCFWYITKTATPGTCTVPAVWHTLFTPIREIHGSQHPVSCTGTQRSRHPGHCAMSPPTAPTAPSCFHPAPERRNRRKYRGFIDVGGFCARSAPRPAPCAHAPAPHTQAREGVPETTGTQRPTVLQGSGDVCGHTPRVRQGGPRPRNSPLLTGGRKRTAHPQRGRQFHGPRTPHGATAASETRSLPPETPAARRTRSGGGKGLLTPPYAQLELRLVQVLHIVAQEAVQQIRHHWFQHHGVGGPSAAAAGWEGSGAQGRGRRARRDPARARPRQSADGAGRSPALAGVRRSRARGGLGAAAARGTGRPGLKRGIPSPPAALGAAGPNERAGWDGAGRGRRGGTGRPRAARDRHRSAAAAPPALRGAEKPREGGAAAGMARHRHRAPAPHPQAPSCHRHRVLAPQQPRRAVPVELEAGRGAGKAPGAVALNSPSGGSRRSRSGTARVGPRCRIWGPARADAGPGRIVHVTSPGIDGTWVCLQCLRKLVFKNC